MSTHEQQARIFGIFIILFEIAMGFIYGYFQDYSEVTSTTHYLLIITAMILALIGFGMILFYVQQSSAISVAHLIILFGISLQIYFPMHGTWQFIKLSASRYMDDPESDKVNLLPISLINDLNDRQTSDQLKQVSLLSWVQCLISLIVAYSAVIGRVGNIQVVLLGIFGTIGYTFNELMFWNFFITDCGGAARIFLFGGTLGLIFSILMTIGQKQTTKDHPNFKSTRAFQIFAFVGSIIITILLPVLCWVDLLHHVGNDGYIIHSVCLNIWLSLCGSIIGSYCFSLIKFKKLAIHDLIYSIFSGGIAYMALSDLYFNPGVAIGIGTLTGLLISSTINIKWFMNFNGVYDSSGVISAFLLPGFIASVLSAIFHANTPQEYGSYSPNVNDSRNNFDNGWYQMAGAGFCIGIALVVGLIGSIIARMFNQRQFQDQFTSRNHFIFANSEEGKQVKSQ